MSSHGRLVHTPPGSECKDARSADGLIRRLGLGRPAQHFWHPHGRPDRPAPGARRPAAPASRITRDQRGTGGRADPGLPLQDQPDGTWAGRLQGARRERPADALRSNRQRGARGPAEPGPGGQHTRLVARILGRHADLAGAVRGPGSRGLGAPDLRGPVRPRAAADRGVRAGADPPRLRGQRGRDRPPGRAAGQPPGGPGRPVVTVQILPFTAGPHSAMGGPFTILRFAEPDLHDVVYIEQLTSALYLDKPSEVDSYLEVMEQLCLQAEPAGNTVKMLNQILADIS